MTEPDGNLKSNTNVSRRRLLKIVGGFSALGVIAYLTEASQKSKTIQRVKKVIAKLPNPTKKLPAPPTDPAKNIPGLTKLITPNSDFFRIDTAFNIPNIDSSSWKLEITGMVKKPITLSYQELLQRPLFELDYTLSCVSNPVGGTLIGNARWLGVRLDDLINEAQPLTRADQILSSSDDGFSAGFPLSVLDGRDAMIAIGMNGEALTAEHGYPARLIVPGLYGYVSATKWVTKIELTRFDIKQGYWIEQGWSVLAPIKMQSRIDTPSFDTKPGLTKIAGVAWAPNEGVGAVQVRIDNKWQKATLGPVLAKTTWRQWWLDWEATKGDHVLSVRAINTKGEVQPERIKGVLPDGAEGWHTVTITVQ